MISNWDFIGPFIIGKGEVDGDNLGAYGGIREVEKNRNTINHQLGGKEKEKGKKKKVEIGVDAFYSEFADGGKVVWKSFESDKEGTQRYFIIIK